MAAHNKVSLLAAGFLIAGSLPGMATGSPSTAEPCTVWADGHSGGLPKGKKISDYLVRNIEPQYPLEAQRKSITGSGSFAVHVDQTGAVNRVVIKQSTGSAILDRAATSALKQWRFKPGVFKIACLPVTFAKVPR